jgi:general secretion pathway protein J
MRDPEAGVTLVEMLVALALLALVGLASFGLLDAVIRVRDGTDGRLEAVAGYDRALLLFGRDLAASEAGSQSLEEGRLGFTLGAQAMSWGVEDGLLLRRAGEEIAQPLLGGLVTGRFRLLDADGAWHEEWEGDEAPVAAEMRLDLPGEATLRRLVPLAGAVEP